jgi:hypothetical protein
MTVPSITLRASKGTALTHAEMDSNLTNLSAPNVVIRAGSTTGYASTFYDLTISNTATIGASIAANTVSLTSLVINPTYTFSNTATLTLSNVAGNISGSVPGTIFSAAAGSSTRVPGETLSIANTTTVGAYISSNTLRMDFLPSYIAGISMIAGGTTTTGATGFTVSNTATIGASLSTNTLSISLGTVGTAGTYQGAVTTDVYGRITSASNGFTANITGNGQHLDNIIFTDYKEKTANLGALTGTVSINANTAPIQLGGTSGNILIWANGMSNFGTGESVTLLLRHNANNRIITSDLLFVNQTKTIGGHTACVDAVSIFYDGQNYLASTVKYQA